MLKRFFDWLDSLLKYGEPGICRYCGQRTFDGTAEHTDCWEFNNCW